MSYPVLTNLDLNGNQLLNAGLQQLASDPGTPFEGQIWQNTTSDEVKAYLNGTITIIQSGLITSADITDGTIVQGDLATALVNFLVARANHTGTQLAATISDFDTAVGASASLASNSTADRARANHTGTQLAATISDFNTAVGASAALASNATADRDRANHTGTQLAATISNFDTQVRVSRLDQMASPTTSLPLNAQRITGLADGIAGTDAATVQQVQSSAAGLDGKASVRAGSTANVALTGTQTIDGISLIAGDRVLLKNQTAPAENGIWLVAAGAWSRATDMDSWAEVPGAFVFIEEGTTQGDTGYLSTANPGGTLGTTAIGWTKFTPSVVSTLTKFSQDITGNASATQFTVTHNIGTTDVQISVYDVSNDLEVIVDKKRPSTNTVRIDFASAPANAKVYRVVVIG